MLRDRFWERIALDRMSPEEWEALCDGCGRCCLNKLEDADTGAVAFTCLSCRLLDTETGRCGNYALRKQLVPECVVLSPETLPDVSYWLPRSCAYRRLHEGRGLADWHPLISGNPETVHQAGVSVRGLAIPEYTVAEEDWEDFVLSEGP